MEDDTALRQLLPSMIQNRDFTQFIDLVAVFIRAPFTAKKIDEDRFPISIRKD